MAIKDASGLKSWSDSPNSTDAGDSLASQSSIVPKRPSGGRRQTSLSASLVLSESREIDVERDDWHGDLPLFEHFRVDFSDDTDGFAMRKISPLGLPETMDAEPAPELYGRPR